MGRGPRLCRKVWGRFWWEEDSAEWTLIRIYLQSFPVLCLCIGEIETASTSSVKPISPFLFLGALGPFINIIMMISRVMMKRIWEQAVAFFKMSKIGPKNGGNKVKIWATWLGGGWWAGREPNGLETFLSWHLQHSSSSWPEIAIVYVFVCIVFLCFWILICIFVFVFVFVPVCILICLATFCS